MSAGMAATKALSAAGIQKEYKKFGAVQESIKTTSKISEAGNPERVLATAIEKLEQAKSMHAALTMDMEVEAFRMDLGARAVVDMVVFQSPYKVKSECSLDMGILGDAELTVIAAERAQGQLSSQASGKAVSKSSGQASGKTVSRVSGKALSQVSGKAVSQAENLAEGYTLYVKNGNNWQEKTVDARQVQKYDGRRLMKVYLEQIEDLEKIGEEKLSGSSV